MDKEKTKTKQIAKDMVRVGDRVSMLVQPQRRQGIPVTSMSTTTNYPTYPSHAGSESAFALRSWSGFHSPCSSGNVDIEESAIGNGGRGE